MDYLLKPVSEAALSQALAKVEQWPTLGELENELGPQRFFRANRQLLAAAGAVQRFAPAGKGRLKLDLRPALEGELLISQERAAAFRAWLDG